MAAAHRGGDAADPRGRSLTTALESTGMLENLALEMVKVGEQTGALADMLTAVADFYDEEMDTRLATVHGPGGAGDAGVMAVVVAGMLLAFYLPLFQAISAIQPMSETLPSRRPPWPIRPVPPAAEEEAARPRAGRALPARVRGRGAPSRPTPRSCSRCRSS